VGNNKTFSTALDTYNSKYKESVVNQHTSAVTRVVTHAAKEEVEKYAALLKKGLDKLKGMVEELKAIKPDQEAVFSAEGEQLKVAGYSKKLVDQIKKKQSSIDKLNSAVTKCMELTDGNTYDELERAYQSLTKLVN
jgi:ribosomal protein S17E